MDEERKDAETGTPDIFVPFSEEKPPFSASPREIIAALAMYVVAYLYTGSPWPGWLAVFTAGFIILTEYLHWNTKRSTESWVWLGCMVIILASMLLPEELSLSHILGSTQTDRVWEMGLSETFLHVFAVYWVLCRSGRLCEAESGRFLPLDALHGFVVFPFGHFFLRIRTLFYGIRQLAPKKRNTKPAQVIGIILAVLVALGLFGMAADLLGQADSEFFRLTEKIIDFFRIEWNEDFLIRFLFSLPIGAYLFGLLAGSGRETPEKLHSRADAVSRTVGALRRVPETVWTVVLAVFSALYAAFFVLQGTYLFGAFTRTLPEGFIVSQYAREGFFELCKVMAVNFALLWCITRSSSHPVHSSRPLLVMCVALLAESMLFVVIAFSKLALYIDCFGFTPLRLQSSWLVCVLFFGCVCALATILTKRKTFRSWMMFGAITLALLHLY